MANETIERKIKPLSLDEAISHADEVAGDCDTDCKREHKQLADWLRELKNRRNGSGDAAKLREALKLCSRGMCGYCILDAEARGMTTECVNGCEALRKAKAALAAPPRNCDKYPTFNDAIRALADKRGWHDGKWDSERYCILAIWLLAPATEKEGGAK